MSTLKTNYNATLEIDINPSGSSNFQVMNKGWANLSKTLNEVLQEFFYLGDGGFGNTEVTGMHVKVTVTGKRYYGDLVQDYIFSSAVQYGLLDARKTNFRLTTADGVVSGEVTLANIQDLGGDAQNGSDVSVEIHFNGQPSTTATALGDLTVVSVAGSTSGDTAIYVNPALTGGNSYVYKTDTTVSLPAYGDDLSSGWTAWNGTADITATTGDEIVIAEVDGSTLAVKAGKATVTSLA